MREKKHYQVLNVHRSASLAEIKSSFRKLALQYHPDKNQQHYLPDAFLEILEAYEILSDAKKRAAYDYRQSAEAPGFTENYFYIAEALIHAAEKLNRFVYHTPVYSIDHDLLFFRWKILLSRERMRFEDGLSPQQTDTIIHTASRSLELLPYKMAHQLIVDLYALNGSDVLLKPLIRQIRLQHYWNRYKALFVLIITIAACFFIYRLAK